MKYQIYLNKETSDFINQLAEIMNKKPNTAIKEIVEDFVKLSRPLQTDIFEEVKNGKKYKRK